MRTPCPISDLPTVRMTVPSGSMRTQPFGANAGRRAAATRSAAEADGQPGRRRPALSLRNSRRVLHFSAPPAARVDRLRMRG